MNQRVTRLSRTQYIRSRPFINPQSRNVEDGRININFFDSVFDQDLVSQEIDIEELLTPPLIILQPEPERPEPEKIRDDSETVVVPSAPSEELLDPKNKEHVLSLAMRCAANPAQVDELARKMESFIDEFNQVSLPATPEKEFEGGDVIAYLRDEKGLGPWNKAHVLSRKYLRDNHKKVFWALMNYLRKHDLPTDIFVPTKSEQVERKLVDTNAIAEARRIKENLRSRGRSL